MDGSSADMHPHQESSSSAASPMPSQAPSRRTKVSCLPCRTRKSKCDHARPCSSCVLRGTAHQCSDPNGSTSAAAPGQTSTSGTMTPTKAASKSRSLPSSSSLPALSEYAHQQGAPGVDSVNGNQHKRRRTEALSSRLSEVAVPARHPSAAESSYISHGADQEIGEEMQRMKQAVGRLEDLLRQRASPISTSSHHALNSSSSTDQPSSASTEYHIDPAQDCPGDTDPPTPDSRQRWHHLRSILPPLIDIHFMMHYLLVEADWLMSHVQPARFVARWRYAYERQAISDVFAVQVLTIVACSALFLSDNPKRTIHCAVPIRTLHTKLMKEAVRMVEAMPALRKGRSEAETCDLLELMLNISIYFRSLGREVPMGRFTERAITYSIRSGFDNELRPSWLGLTQAQVERRRELMSELNMSAKWMAFHCRNDRIRERIQAFNIGQPHFESIGQLPPLEAWPQADHLTRTAAARASEGAHCIFAWRQKSDEERAISRNFLLVFTSVTNEHPSIVELVTKTEARLLQPEALAKCTKKEMRDMARQTRQILSRLQEWHTTIFPNHGFGFEKIVNANIVGADPFEAKFMACILMCNHAVFYMTSILCRAWLLLSDRLESLNDAVRESAAEFEQHKTVNSNFLAHLKQRSLDHVQHAHAAWLPSSFLTDMEAAAAENARRCIQCIPVIRTLQSHSSSQFFVGWICQSFLQAAVNLAIPLVRSHARQQFDHQPELHKFASLSIDQLRRDVVTIFEAVPQLSYNVEARKTQNILHRAMRLSGLPSDEAKGDDEDGVEDAWEEEVSNTAGQMQNAAEGLALLSAASASARTPSTDGKVQDGALSREPMWWESRPVASIDPKPTQPDALAGLGGAQHHMSDSQLLDELLNFDPSFWQFVFDGSTNVPTTV